MATKTYYFLGGAKWCKVKEPDAKYNKTGLDLYMTERSWAAFEKSGMQIKVRKADDGTPYVKLSRPWEKLVKGEIKHLGPPEVLIRSGDDYVPFDGLIGNGSLVNVKVSVYDTSRGKGHQLETIAVETLVPYEKNVDAETGELMPF